MTDKIMEVIMTEKDVLRKVHESGWLKAVTPVTQNPHLVQVQVTTVKGDIANYQVYRASSSTAKEDNDH